MQRVEDVLRECAGRAGARTGFGIAADRICHADLDESSERLAGVLQAQGIGPGDRAAVFMDAKPAAFIATFAALKAGGVVCPVGLSASAEQLTHVLNDSCAACLFVDAGLAPVAAAAMAEAPLLRLVVVCGAEGAPAIDGLIRYEDAVAADRRPLVPPEPGLDPAMLLYPQLASGVGEATAISHAAILDAAPRGEISGAVGALESLVKPLLAAVAGMRPHRSALPDAAA